MRKGIKVSLYAFHLQHPEFPMKVRQNKTHAPSSPARCLINPIVEHTHTHREFSSDALVLLILEKERMVTHTKDDFTAIENGDQFIPRCFVLIDLGQFPLGKFQIVRRGH